MVELETKQKAMKSKLLNFMKNLFYKIFSEEFYSHLFHSL
ncbi:hypothetical protein VAEKB19_1140001 [Vibrio aestuarianus]|nr:hypothetical protein VAEKB19_1140001 [Vibrio aestuarianus]